MILVVDTHGFTTNILSHQLGAVHSVTATELETLNLHDYTHVVIPHGPDQPQLHALKSAPQLPVLALGAGYQQLAAAYGHIAVGSSQPVYGQVVAHHHSATGLFVGVPNPAALVSYHPWRLTSMDTELFSTHAVDEDDAVLAFRVHGTHHWGLHADPAALLSTHGNTILENFLSLSSPEPVHTPVRPVETPAAQRTKVFTRTIKGTLDTWETFRRLQRDASAAFWLDSAAAHRDQGDTTIMGTNAGPLAQTVRWDAETNHIDVHQDNTTQRLTKDVLDYLDANMWHADPSVDLPGFTGGWVGYLGYEAKHATVAGYDNSWQASTPDAYWIRPQAFLRYDHAHDQTTLCAFADPHLLDGLETALVFGQPDPPPETKPGSVKGHWRLAAAEYAHRVTEIQAKLHAGQAAGICLTDTFELDQEVEHGLELYGRLRTKNPAPYAGYLRFNTFDDALEILSASPEKFLSVDGEGLVESKPIKGTVARSSDPVQDAQIAQRMAADPKIQSENLMITDLLRDDLAKVVVPGTVAVPKLMAVESFATVHQLVTTVQGHLRPDTSATTALRAVFPGGSMTGAPKIASLEVLDTLEAGPRGVYSGAMGWLGFDNTAEVNVVIRSIVIEHGRLTVGAGGAVVVDSDPAAEEQEKHLKAQALIESIAEHL